MSRLKLRPWTFEKSEVVELYWHGIPFMNSEGLWMIKCLFRRDNGTFKEHVFSFGTLPHLRIGQSYVDGDFAEMSGTGKLYEVKIPNNVRPDLCKGFDFPKSLYAFDKPPAPGYGNLPLCRFEVAGILYYIPCTEVVRSILAPFKMLANQILRPEGLNCFIESSSAFRDKLELNLTEEYRLDLLKDDIISYFVWLKFDKSAKKSWDSVYKNIILEASKSPICDTESELRKGIPITVIPPINGAPTWTFRGLAFKNHRLILELLHRSDIEIPFSVIECSHPKLEKLETDSLPRYSKDPSKQPLDNKDVELDTTGQGSERQHRQNIIEQPPIMFSFNKKPKIFRKRNITRKVHAGKVIVIGTKQDDGNEGNVGTTQDWVQGGNIPQIEFSILKMVDTNLSKGLEGFLKLIGYIQTHYKKLSLSLSIVTLPQLKSFSQYDDGSIRTCAIVRVERQGNTPCYIIEIGRADDWSISTLIVSPVKSDYAETEAFERLYQKLLRNMIDNNGHWDKSMLALYIDYKFDIAKHISGQSIYRWAERLVEKINI